MKAMLTILPLFHVCMQLGESEDTQIVSSYPFQQAVANAYNQCTILLSFRKWIFPGGGIFQKRCLSCGCTDNHFLSAVPPPVATMWIRAVVGILAAAFVPLVLCQGECTHADIHAHTCTHCTHAGQQMCFATFWTNRHKYNNTMHTYIRSSASTH